jgi:serine protease AprX
MDDADDADDGEIDWNELEMPALPEAPTRRRTIAGVPMKTVITIGSSFAMFVLALLLALIASNMLKGGILFVPDPALREREAAFMSQSGFDNISGTGAEVDVCIIDTGIDLAHPDLSGRELAGWKDLINQQNEPYDDQGHGTGMAGILIADGHLTGVSKGVDLYVVKALAFDGQGTDEVIAEAVDWCVAQAVDIISLSLGGGQGIDFFLIETDNLEAAVDRALDEGVFVVAAAGNDGEDDDGDVSSPGSVEDVICVGAIDQYAEIWIGSSVGDNNGDLWPPKFPRQNPDMKPELVAPGYEIPILMIANDLSGGEYGYGWGTGTSGATVWVTGAIAQLLEQRPELRHDGTSGGRATVEDVKEWVSESSLPTDGGSGHDDYYGYGRLRVDLLLSAANA